jgi:hypothetical protein
VRGADILQAAAECRELLDDAVDADWNVPVPGLEFTVSQVVAHAATGPLWYALDIWSGSNDDAAFEVTVKSDAANAALLLSLTNAAW